MFIFNLTQSATRNVFVDKVCIFGLTQLASWKRTLGQIFKTSWTRCQTICTLTQIRWETAGFLRKTFLLTNNYCYFKWPKYWLQLQLPVKCGSGGFRWASFRSCRLSAWLEIARNPPLRVASYVSGQFIATWNGIGFDRFLKLTVRAVWKGFAVWKVFRDFGSGNLKVFLGLKEPSSLKGF
jgi:hypothetical protein